MEKTVLIVSDAAFLKMMISDTLSKNGYQIVGKARNGKEGIEEYMKLKPDLVIMEMTMPEMDGLEATKAILAKEPSAAILLMSPIGAECMMIEAAKAGAKEYLVKPFKREMLLHKVAHALQ